ncbi:hypothetical protein LG943_12950 [Streptomonospora sp. S1-112]|uniref:Uncharacterized protein n=1 Tax=Streptomonospora mangrovi TaxID=2883123 RepID=A0A9X3NKL6_9ACTN|nr:hypothetical protein [Streptomonospora mangrovi]MDA0565217.1 hypothetical protein [Streptomonospora mangrovi]
MRVPWLVLPDSTAVEWFEEPLPEWFTPGFFVVVVFLLVFTKVMPERKGNARLGMEERIDQAHARLREGASLIEEVSAELETRRVALERLRAQREQYEKLAALDHEQAQAVTRLVEATVEKGHRRAGRAAWFQQMLFFLLGVVATPLARWVFPGLF